ncbi:hypothetical protein BDR04DRAFT_345741 [Suillus decipiens]|nr:hypothetical protein BDR04DRAFT_345741 [Suillus decipiens]
MSCNGLAIAATPTLMVERIFYIERVARYRRIIVSAYRLSGQSHHHFQAVIQEGTEDSFWRGTRKWIL